MRLSRSCQCHVTGESCSCSDTSTELSQWHEAKFNVGRTPDSDSEHSALGARLCSPTFSDWTQVPAPGRPRAAHSVCQTLSGSVCLHNVSQWT